MSTFSLMAKFYSGGFGNLYAIHTYGPENYDSYYLTKIYENEANLDDGRFRNFTYRNLPYTSAKLFNSLVSIHSDKSMIDWIGENVYSPWGIKSVRDLEIKNVGVYNLLFTFENENEKTLFDLTFA